MWIAVANLDELNELQPFRAVAGDERITLFRDGATVYCLKDQCTHAEVPLSTGMYDRKNHIVTCPQHGAKFDVITGKALSMPAITPVETYSVRIVGNEIQINLED